MKQEPGHVINDHVSENGGGSRKRRKCPIVQAERLIRRVVRPKHARYDSTRVARGNGQAWNQVRHSKSPR
jgi:hypothetical protein